jgi:methylated-DNA-[protein]-cysteine S-methyltransferase
MNPNPISTPCHRVVSSNGSIGGYSGSGGVQMKKALLEKEGVIID